MIRKIGYSILCLMIWSCSSQKDISNKIPTTGIVNYSIHVESSGDESVTTESFGDKATVHFNEKFVHFKKDNGKGGDENFQMIEVATGTEFNYLTFRDKKYELKTTPDMLPPISTLTFHKEKKSILGIECQKATAQMGDEEMVAWFTKAIGINFCPYVAAQGFALEYSLPMPFGRVTYTATQVRLNQNDAALLIPPTDYKKTTMKELQRELSGGGTLAPSSNIVIGNDAPNFIAQNLKGELVDLNSLKGKVVLLNFWFINCPPCRMEMPDLNELKAEYKNQDDVEFISITFDQTKQIQKFLKKIPFEFQIIPDAQPIIDDYEIQGFPTSIVIGKDGKISNFKMGGSFNIKDELKAFIEKALKE